MKIYISRLYGLLGLLIICAILLVGCFDSSNGQPQANAAGGGTGGVKGSHATPTSTSVSTPTATPTNSSGPTQAPGQSPSQQPAPTSTPPTPTPTPVPTAPNIVGSYSGSYTWSGSATTYPMQLNISSQSGSNLTGTTTEGSTVYNDTGTIDTSGNFTITEYSGGNVVAYLYGSSSGNQLSGTWKNTGNSGGNWSVSK